jgi:hypothetical protein
MLPNKEINFIYQIIWLVWILNLNGGNWNNKSKLTDHEAAITFLLQCSSHKAKCRCSLTRVPWATDYNPKTLGYDWFPPAANGWGTIYPVLGNGPTTLGWRGWAINIKRINPEDHPCCQFSSLRLSAGKQDFTTCLPFLPLSSTQGRDPGPRASMPRGFPQQICITYSRPREASVLRYDKTTLEMTGSSPKIISWDSWQSEIVQTQHISIQYHDI